MIAESRIRIPGIRTIIAATILACFISTMCPVVYAQNIEGQIIASQYGSWKVPGYAPDSYNFAPNSCRVQGGASFFPAFTPGVPVKIVDGNPSLSEDVIPTAVVEDNSRCSITIAPQHHHLPPFYFTSGTAGLQEAINANLANPGPNTILLNNEWYRLGGTAAIISSVKGASQLGLVDVTQVPAKWYQWDGSQYVTVNPPGSAGAATLVNDLVSNKGDGSFQDLYHFYATGASYSVQNAVNAAAQSSGTVTIQPTAGHTPFSSSGEVGITDERQDVLAKPKSIKEFGAQCDGVVAGGTFTAGSNQVTNTTYAYIGSGGSRTPLSDYGDGTAILAIGWKDTTTGAQYVWEPTITSVSGSVLTLSGNAPADIPSGVSFVIGHDDTTAFNALNSYLPLAEIEFPSSIYKGCLTHTITWTHSSGPILLKGQWSSSIMGFPGEDVFNIAPNSSTSLKVEGLTINVNDQVDVRQGYTLIKADGTQQIFPPMWKDGGVKRFWGQGTPWANNPTMSGWQGQTLSAAQGTSDTTINVVKPLINLTGDHGYNGVSSYGCVKIPDQNDLNSEIECYENFSEDDSGASPVRYFRNVQRGMYQSLGFSPATAHASGASVVPVDPVSPLTPFIVAGTDYSFRGLILQRANNVVTVTLPAPGTVFSVAGAEIEIVGTGTGDFAGANFAVASASGTTVTFAQTGPNEGPVSAPSGYAALVGTMRPVVWPAFAVGNAALASDLGDVLSFGGYSPGTGGDALTYSNFTSDSFNAYMTANNDSKGTAGVWMQGGMYHVLWDDIQSRASFGFINAPPFLNTHVYLSPDTETNTYSRFDVHSGFGFVLSQQANGYVRALNDYSEEDPDPVADKILPGIGPSMLPLVDDKTGVVSSTAVSMTWDQLYSEPAQYTTEMKSGYYQVYYTSDSVFGPGAQHSLNAGSTLLEGNNNLFDGATWNVFPVGVNGQPILFIRGDNNHGWLKLSSASNWGDGGSIAVMDEGSNNQCWATSGSTTFDACRGLALPGGSTGDWAQKGITSIQGVYGSDQDLIFTPQTLLMGQNGADQWGSGSFLGFDQFEPQNFTYAAQPASAFTSGNIRPYSFGISTAIGTNFPAVHGTLYIMAKASTATNETFHAYYYGNSVTCGAGVPQYLDQGGVSGVGLPLTTSWQIFSFGVNLQNTPTSTPDEACGFFVGDDAPSNGTAEIDTAWIQFVPDSQFEAASVYSTRLGSPLPSASTVALPAGLEHITGTSTILRFVPPTPYFTGCVDLIPDGAWQTATGGNIAVASAAVPGRVLRECYDGANWYPSY